MSEHLGRRQKMLFMAGRCLGALDMLYNVLQVLGTGTATASQDFEPVTAMQLNHALAPVREAIALKRGSAVQLGMIQRRGIGLKSNQPGHDRLGLAGILQK